MRNRATDKTREQNLIKLAHKGRCTTQELLEADFGHWPPNGLNITAPPEGHIKIKSSFATLATTPRHWPGMIDITDIAIWYLITKSMTKSLAISIGSKVMGIMGFVDPSMKERAIHLNDVLSLYGRAQTKSEYLANVISHEHFHQIQKDDRDASLSSALEDRLKVGSRLKDGGTKFTRYLANEAELQARIHTIMANTYQQHGRLPKTLYQFISALASQGVEVPERIMDTLEKNQRGKIAIETFPKDPEFIENNADKSAGSEISKVGSTLEDEHQLTFWLMTLPRIYGDLIELYGDSHGTARMDIGIDHNVQLREVFYKNVQSLSDCQPQNVGKHLSCAYAAVAAMPDDQAQQLFGLVLRETPYRAAGHVIRIPEEHHYGLVNLFRMREQGVPPQVSIYEQIEDDTPNNDDRNNGWKTVSTEGLLHATI